MTPSATPADSDVEAQIARWRDYLDRRSSVTSDGADELEDHLRGHIDALTAAGLDADEAFLVAIKRVGAQDAIAREFARDNSTRLWKQLVLTGDTPRSSAPRRLPVRMLAFAVCSGAAAKAVFWALGSSGDAFAALAPFVVAALLVFLAAYFAADRRASGSAWAAVAAALIVPPAIVAALPLGENSQSLWLAVAHLTIVAWLAVGLAYVGGNWRDHGARMDFIRFTGEWVIYMTLLAISGQVLLLLAMGVFAALGAGDGSFLFEWVLPLCFGGALVVAAWLVEAKQSVVENIAPILTRIFTPIVTVMVVAFLVAFVVASAGSDFNRELLIVFDAVLALVLGLVLYALSARDSASPASWFDWMQLVLVAVALVLDVLVLGALAARIGDWGLTPNRVAGLGMNLVLLVNLAVAAWRSLAFVRGRGSIAALERWQTGYVPVYGAWALAVAVALPVLFRFA